jgi:hypothetical protein
MYDEVYSWFGCCTGTDITDCNVATACVPSKSMDECLEDESCYGDPLALAWYVTTFLFFFTFDLSYHQRQYFPSISSTPHRVRASFFSFSYHYAMFQLCNSPDVRFYFWQFYLNSQGLYLYFLAHLLSSTSPRVYSSSVTQFTPERKTTKCSLLSSTVSKTGYYCTVNVGTTLPSNWQPAIYLFYYLRSG